MKRLTEATVKAVKPAEKRQEIADAVLPGLYLIVQPSGSKSWAVRYRHHGKTRKLTLGKFPVIGLADARASARKEMATLEHGRDPARAKQEARIAETVGEAVAEFITRYAKPRNRSWQQTQRIFDKEVLPEWKDRKLASIARRDVIALLDPIADRAPILANRTHAALRKLFSWCLERDLIPASPIAGIKAPAQAKSRDRVLDPAELVALWKASEAEAWPFGPWLRLLILTGQRKMEVAGARWDEFDGDSWTIPSARTKNKREHTLPLPPAAVAILDDLPRVGDSGLVFPASHSRSGDIRSFSGFSKLKARLDAAMAADLEREASRWTFHDVRRTAVSGMAGLGIPPHTIERTINHVSGAFGGVAGVYNRHKYEAEMRRALEAWADRVAALVEGRETAGNVVELRRGQP